jgi:hypothetical protein
MKPAIVGLRNPYRDVDALSPDRGAGRALWRMSGMSREEYLTTYDRVNVYRRARHARLLSHELVALRGLLANRRVVVLGREAWRALLLPADVGWFGEVIEHTTGSRFTLLPHPSGRCREYNDPANKERARTCLLSAARAGGGTETATTIRSTRTGPARSSTPAEGGARHQPASTRSARRPGSRRTEPSRASSTRS